MFQAALSSIPYRIFEQSEAFYHSILLTFLWTCGIDVKVEEMTSSGRSDLVLVYNKTVWVIELKTTDERTALEQIKEKGYHKKYYGNEVFLVGVTINLKERRLEGYALEVV